MKKFEKIFLAFILFFATIAFVNAKDEVFKYDWSKEQLTESTVLDGIIPFNSIFNFKNGYVNADVYGERYPITKLTYYDYKGELKYSSTLRYNFVLGMNSIEDNLYVLSYNYEEDLVYIIKYDDELNEINSIDVPEFSQGALVEIVSMFKLYGMNIISNVNNEISLPGMGEDKLYVFDRNLDSYSRMNATENLIKKYYPKFYELEIVLGDLADDYTRFLSVDLRNENKAGSGMISSCSLRPNLLFEEGISTYDLCPAYGFIALLDEDNNVLWEKEYEEYRMIVNARFVDEYIVAIGYSGEYYDEIGSDILVFDMEGNLVQKIDGGADVKYFLIEPSEAGFVVNRTLGTCRDIGSKDVDRSTIVYDCEMQLEAYYLPRKITTKIVGEGTFKVVDEARAGEEISFEATPKNGYVLDSIKITDKEGNVVEYNSNKFIMPASDVLIEAVFLPKNPETKDMAIISVVLITALMFGVMLINYKKVKFLS